MKNPKRENSSLRIILPMLPLLSAGLCPPAPLALAAETPEQQTIVVADGTTQSVMEATEVSAVTLGSGSTLYVAADALTLSGTMTVQNDSHLVVKDGGVVQLTDYADYKTDWAANKRTAELFHALLNSTLTEDGGVVKINSVSVQFGHINQYNLLKDSTDNINATFNAHYQIAENLTLQNFEQGNAGKDSLWKIGSKGVVEVGGNLYLASWQQLDVEKGASLEVKGTLTMGHTESSKYKAKLTIADGSKVVLGQIGDERTQNDGLSQLVMTGGELTFTHEGNAVTHTLGGVSLQGGTLVAEGNNWTLNNNATLGSAETDVILRTDADHSITLGTAVTTTTMAGNIIVREGSHAILNGTYAGEGLLSLQDGASLTLSDAFAIADSAALSIDGTGVVRLDGIHSAPTDGFNKGYDFTYTLSGAQGIKFAKTLLWQDAAGNALTDLQYNAETGVFSGYAEEANKTLYYIVTEGHQAKVDADGAAKDATAFLMENDGKLFIGKDYSVSADQITQNGHTLTLQGSGDYVLGGYIMPQKVVFDKADGTAWTGAVVISGAVSGNKVQSFDAFYQQESSIAMSGFNGIPAEWNNGTLQANIRLDAQPDGKPAWRWDSGTTGTTSYTTTFQGNWAGEGDFILGQDGGSVWKQNFTYAGDVRDWTGRFLVESGTSTVTFTGGEKDINATFDKGNGTLNLSIQTDTRFHTDATVSTLTVSAGKTVTLDKGTEMHVSNALPSGTNLGQHLQTDYFNHVSGDGTLFLNFGASEYDQMSIAANTTVTPDVNTVFTGDRDKHQNLAISMWNATSGGLNLDHSFMVVDEMTLQWGAGLTLGKTENGVGQLVANTLHMGHSDGNNRPARVTLSGGTAILGGIDISSTHQNTFTMTGGVLEISNSGNALTTTAKGTEQTLFTLAGGALRADGKKWVWNHDATIGENNGSALSVETLNGGAVTIGAAGVTTTLANTIDNRGTLTLDGTVNITMAASDKANGYVDQDGNFGMSVGFAATVFIPDAETYNVVTGNAATLGQNIVWKAGDKVLTVVDKDAADAPAGSYYFDGYNLRRTDEETEAEPERTGTVYYVGGRGGEYSFDKAEYAEIVTGFDIANGTLKVEVSPENDVTLNLGAGSLQLGEKVEMTVAAAQDWSMDKGASVVLGVGSVLTLPGVEPETKADSYKVYQLLNNSTGNGTIVFDGTLDVQFGNAGHNFVSPDSYNFLEDNGTADTGLNADIKTNVVVNGDMLIQNYRQGKDHPEVGSWWKVSEGGSLTVHGDLESSSYQKVSVAGGDMVVDGTYKIGHEAGGQYEGDLELKSGALTVGTLQTVHEDTSTVHISGGTLKVTKDKAFANSFREVSAENAAFDGTWTWNHNADIGAITVTEGSAITLGTADTVIILTSPLTDNQGSLILNGTFIVNMEPTAGGDVYGTETTGYTKDGDGYLKNEGDVYTLVRQGNDAVLAANAGFVLNGQKLTADEADFYDNSIHLNATDPGTVYYLNTDRGYTYTDADTRTSSFELLNAGATLRLERELTGEQSIHALGGVVSLGNGVSMEAARLHAENTVTMAGEGTYLLSGNTLMAHPAEHHVSFGTPAWTGTVQTDGMLGSVGSLNDLGNANSWVEMKGVFGADAAATMDVNVKLTDTENAPAWIYTGDGHAVAVTGDWAGDGRFDFAPVGGATQQLTYSGNLSAWTGTFSAQGGTAQLHFAGEAHEVNAAILQNGGRTDLTAETDTHFTNRTETALYEATGGHLTADKADAAAIDSIRATGGDVTLQGLAADTSVELKELVIGDSRSVTALAAGGDVAQALLGEGSLLTAGQAATLTADLSVQSGSTLSIADRTQGLVLNGALSLGDGGNIQLDDAMKTSLAQTGKLVLFSGVSELTLPGGTVITGALSALDNEEAERYFSGLIQRLNSSGKGETYFLTYSGAENGGFLCIETPEPTIPLLSLLGLFCLVARRRR